MNPTLAMPPLLKKLQYKPPVVVYALNHPTEFEIALSMMKDHVAVATEWPAESDVSFVLSFVQSEKEIKNTMDLLQQRLIGDGILWFAFPKKSSKKYAVEINRDHGWDSLIQNGFVPVRSVSIDEDWTALRFRRVEYIKSMTRTFNPAYH